MLGWLKRKAFERELKATGRRLAEGTMTGKLEQLRNWSLRNKGPIGAAFVGMWSWAEVTGCPAVYGIDIISLTGVPCLFAQKVLGAVGFLLIGGGWITKDDMERRKQLFAGKIPDPRGTTQPIAVAKLEAAKDAVAKAEVEVKP